MKIDFKSITLKNFLSFGNSPQTIRLDTKGKTLILGKSSSGLKNGCGKSVMADAVSFCLYGKTIRDIAVTQIVNDVNGKQCEATIDFNSGNKEYKIFRGKKPDKIKITENNEDITPSTIPESNLLIESIIGIDYKTFKTIILFSLDDFVPFLSMDAQKQREMVERVINLTRIGEIKKNLKKSNRQLKQDFQLESSRVNLIEKQNLATQESIDNILDNRKNWETKNKADINRVKAELANHSNIDIKLNKEIFVGLDGLNSDMESKSSELEPIAYSVLTLESKINANEKAIESLRRQVDKLDGQIDDLNSGKCPTCGQSTTDKSLVKAFKDEKKDCLEKASDLDKTNSCSSKDLNGYREEYKTIAATIDRIESSTELLESKLQVSSLSKLQDIESAEGHLKDEIGRLEKEENPYLTIEIPTLTDCDNKELHRMEEELAEYDYLINEFLSDTGAPRKTLVSCVLPYLNSRIAHYLGQMQSVYSLKFANDFTPTIISKGREKTFGQLSAGQKQRINLAISFAFRDILAKTSGTVFSMLILDEILDASLDEAGAADGLNILNSFVEEGTDIFLISHRQDFLSKFDNTIEVELRGSFSFIDQQ